MGVGWELESRERAGELGSLGSLAPFEWGLGSKGCLASLRSYSLAFSVESRGLLGWEPGSLGNRGGLGWGLVSKEFLANSCLLA